jgi:hypothetical protein
MMQIASGFSSFVVGGPSSSTRSYGAISHMGCVVPHLFATRGNRSYPEFWAITDDPWYPGLLFERETKIMWW